MKLSVKICYGKYFGQKKIKKNKDLTIFSGMRDKKQKLPNYVIESHR